MSSLLRLIDHFQGAALGTFIGDAMGRGKEGWSWEGIRAHLGVIDGVGEGIYTDDTEMMIGVMEALREDPAFDPAVAARCFLDNFHPWRGYGGRIYGVMARLQQGVAWDKAGTDSWGNGGAMRIAPIGFFFFDDRVRLREAAWRCAYITHHHPEGLAGALVQAVAVGIATAKGLRNEKIDSEAYVAEIAMEARGVDAGFAAEIERIRGLAETSDLEDKISLIAATFPRDVSAKGAVPAAIAAFVLNDNLRNTLITAVNCGGDTDTIGAMAGAIAGAYYGYQAIPKEWLVPLENGPKGREYVSWLAAELARVKFGRSI